MKNDDWTAEDEAELQYAKQCAKLYNDPDLGSMYLKREAYLMRKKQGKQTLLDRVGGYVFGRHSR